MLTVIIFIAGVIFAFHLSTVLISYLINFKQINRERYFESRIIQTKLLHVTNELFCPRSTNYQRYLGSWTWQIISKHATQEMKGKCEFCGGIASAVHHVYYPKKRSELGFEDIASLCVVCKKCHDILHGENYGKSKVCALCGYTKANKTYYVKLNRLGKNKQVVCSRCYAIANGFRDETKELSWENYIAWVDDWQKRVLDDMLLQRYRKKF